MYADEGVPRGALEVSQELMLKLVAIRRARIPPAENPRFPGPGESSQG